MLLAHYGVEPSQTSVATTRALLERALTLDAHQPIGLACLGAVSFFFDRDFDAAQRYLHEALARLPSYSVAMLSLANVQAVRREFEEAEAWLAQALLVDPLDVGISMNLGDHRILSGQYPAAVEALEQAQRLSPGHRPSALRLAWAAALAGNPDLANDTLARLRPAGASPDAPWLEYEAVVAAALGDAARAAAAADALEELARSRFVTSWGRARALAAAGRSAAAIAALSDCVRERSSSVPFMAITPAFTALASEPAFRELVRRAGLP
jgi:predicted Zn-dependent protease